LAYILPAIVYVCLHSNFSGGLRKATFSTGVRFGRLWFWFQSKARDFLFVCHSILCPILNRFRDTASFCAHELTPIPL